MKHWWPDRFQTKHANEETTFIDCVTGRSIVVAEADKLAVKNALLGLFSWTEAQVKRNTTGWYVSLLGPEGVMFVWPNELHRLRSYAYYYPNEAVAEDECKAFNEAFTKEHGAGKEVWYGMAGHVKRQ